MDEPDVQGEVRRRHPPHRGNAGRHADLVPGREHQGVRRAGPGLGCEPQREEVGGRASFHVPGFGAFEGTGSGGAGRVGAVPQHYRHHQPELPEGGQRGVPSGLHPGLQRLAHRRVARRHTPVHRPVRRAHVGRGPVRGRDPSRGEARPQGAGLARRPPTSWGSNTSTIPTGTRSFRRAATWTCPSACTPPRSPPCRPGIRWRRAPGSLSVSP